MPLPSPGKRLTILFIPFFLLACSDQPTATDDVPDDPDEEETETQPQEVSEDNAGELILDFLLSLDLFDSDYFDEDVLQQVEMSLSDTPLVVTSPVPADYVTSSTTDEGAIKVDMWVSEDGTIIPTTEWRQENSEYCLEQNRYMKPAAHLLTKQLHPETQEVFIRYTDVETGVIQQQQHGTGDDDFWVDEALEEAWDQMEDLDHLAVGDPCGEEIDLVLEFDSVIDLRVDGEQIYSRVAAEVPITWSSEEQTFTGEAPLEYLDYFSPVAAEGCTHETSDGVLEVDINFPDGIIRYDEEMEVVLGPPEEDMFPEVTVHCPDGISVDGMSTIWWPFFLLMHDYNLDEYRLLIEGWEEDEDPWVTALFDSEQTDQIPPPDGEGGDLTVIEETEIIIRHGGLDEE